MMLQLSILIGLGLIVLSVVWSTLKTGSPPVPTSPSVLHTMMSLLPARLPSCGPDAGHENIVELGSGWGGVAFALAKRYPEHRIVGYELSILPFVVSRMRLALWPRTNLRFRRTNFLSADLSRVVLAVCYLAPQSMAGLSAKVQAELPTGALVLCNTFSFRSWQERDHKTAPDMYRSPVYLYQIGDN